MNGTPTLYRDQYGQCLWACTVKELREKAGGGRVSKMYVDKTNGKAMHVGYIVGRRWFDAYRPFEQEV